MRPTLQYVTSVDHPQTGLWVLAVPIGGGSVEALSVETANRGAREGWLEGWPPADPAPAPEPERSGPKVPSGRGLHDGFIVSAERLAEFAFTLAGAATGPLLRDNGGYVFPAEEVSELVRGVVQEFFGLDVAALPGYGGAVEIANAAVAAQPAPPHEGVAQAAQTQPEADRG